MNAWFMPSLNYKIFNVKMVEELDQIENNIANHIIIICKKYTKILVQKSFTFVNIVIIFFLLILKKEILFWVKLKVSFPNSLGLAQLVMTLVPFPTRNGGLVHGLRVTLTDLQIHVDQSLRRNWSELNALLSSTNSDIPTLPPFDLISTCRPLPITYLKSYFLNLNKPFIMPMGSSPTGYRSYNF